MMMEENLRDWYSLLVEILWAYKTSKRDAIMVCLFTLTYGHNVVIPMEVLVSYIRVALQNNLIPKDYLQAMIVELEELYQVRMDALDILIL